MGNGESTYDDPYDDFLHQTVDDAESSMNQNYPNKGKSTFIADNFNSLDEVCNTALSYSLFWI